MNIPVFDLHCDTALKLTGREYQAGPGLRSNKLHIDLDRAGTLAGWCQCFACFTTPQMKQWYRRDPGEILEREIDAIMANLDANSDVIRQAFSAAEVSKNLEKGLMSAILTLEGAAGLDYDPALLEDLFALGFRLQVVLFRQLLGKTGCKTGSARLHLHFHFAQGNLPITCK